ncbi:metallophosphoesterase [Xylanibacter oryzae]|uniref:metallophosphoesterase n=1 Tax=Xylanibacter oryzae TaxID=185293 RepID=UPI00055D8CB2|nr:metallophosphoesterase [Xylanibacter oryzae]
MIARIFIYILLMIVLSDIYIDAHYIRHLKNIRWWKRLLWWLPDILMVIYTILLASVKNYAPDNLSWLNVYLFLIGFMVIPKAFFALCSIIGWGYCKLNHSRKNWGNFVGLLLALITIYILIYGSTIGFRKLVIRHVDYYSKDLPASFEGYKIIQWSDAHVGVYTGSRVTILQRAIDSINAQKADVILFTGDLQNMAPQEMYRHIGRLSSLKAKDGVFSVLGNHDYSKYIGGTPDQKRANERETIKLEKSFGWNLLRNENHSIQRGKDSIIIAGEENDGKPPFPQLGDIKKTLKGTSNKNFIVMLQHDPSAWRRSILPKSNAQLTLSGHTHAMQFEIFGKSPASWLYSEWGGMYYSGDRAMNVSVGLGGFVPFRFGASGEIVVIKLHKSK